MTVHHPMYKCFECHADVHPEAPWYHERFCKQYKAMPKKEKKPKPNKVPENVKCCRCMYWVADIIKEDAEGQCRRYPPQVVPPYDDDCLPWERWPDTVGNEFCGEFKA